MVLRAAHTAVYTNTDPNKCIVYKRVHLYYVPIRIHAYSMLPSLVVGCELCTYDDDSGRWNRRRPFVLRVEKILRRI